MLILDIRRYVDHLDYGSGPCCLPICSFNGIPSRQTGKGGHLACAAAYRADTAFQVCWLDLITSFAWLLHKYFQ